MGASVNAPMRDALYRILSEAIRDYHADPRTRRELLKALRDMRMYLNEIERHVYEQDAKS